MAIKETVIRVFPDMKSAGPFIKAMQDQKLHILVNDGVDRMIVHLPQDRMSGWPDKEGAYCIVIASEKPFLPPA